jgi:hypothetical protein
MKYELLYWNRIRIELMKNSLSKNPYLRHWAQQHMDATEEIILTAKAMDFIEDVVR